MRVAALALLAASVASVATDAEAGSNIRQRRGTAAHVLTVVEAGVLRPLYVFTYGQSLTTGSSGGGLPFSTTNGSPTAPPYRNLEYRTSSFVPAYSDSGAANTEIVCYGSMNQIAFALASGDQVTIAGACQTGGVGSQRYAQLEDGTGNWTAQWSEAAGMVSGFAAAQPLASGEPYVLVIWLQGETDQVFGTTRAQYVGYLLDLHADVCAELAAAPYSLTECPAIYMIPYGAPTRIGTSVTTTNGEQSEIVMAHYEACRDYPTQFVCAHQGYQTPYTTANEHPTGLGHAVNGAQIGRVFRHREVLEDGWTMMRPVAGSLVCSGNEVWVPITGGVGTQLVIDTTNAAAKAHLGFEFRDSQTDMPVIVSATVSTAMGAAVLTLSRDCDPTAAPRVRYAYSGIPDGNAGRTGLGGTGGNVRRSSCEPSYWGEDLCDWLVAFDEPVNTVLAAANAVPSFADTGAGARAGASTAVAVSRNSTVTDGAANISVSSWVRMPSSFAANLVIAEEWLGTAARRWSVRTNTTGRIDFYLSSNGTSISYTCTTPASSVTANATTQVGFVKSGTTFTPYIGCVASTCATTSGAVPATLSGTSWAPVSVGNVSGGGSNLPVQVSHLAVWGQALPADRYASLCTSSPVSRPTDPRVQNASHYWPLVADGADYGRATPNPILLYGAQHQALGSTWAASDGRYAFTAGAALNGATRFVALLDFVAATPSQAGTFVDRDNATSTQRQLHLGWTTGRQIVARVATSLTEGGGEWPSDATRDEAVSGALTAGQRYRAVIAHDGAGADNAARLRMWTAPVTETTDGDGKAVARVGAATAQTLSFVGTIPAALTSPSTAVWSVGRRESATTSTGLRSVTMGGDGVVLWAGAALSELQARELLRTGDAGATSLGAPSARWRFRGAEVVEMVSQGVGTLSGTAPTVAQVTPIVTRGPKFPLASRTSLLAQGRAGLGRANFVAGATSPFFVYPSPNTGCSGDTCWVESGIDIIFAGLTPTVRSNGWGWIEVVSGTDAATTGGLFTSAASRVFNAASGFIVETCTEQTPNDAGTRGGILALAEGFDDFAGSPPECTGNYNPCCLVNGLGYCHNAGDAPALGWRFANGRGVTSAVTGAAPYDARRYCAHLEVEAGAGVDSGYALLLDMSNEWAPTVADERVFTPSGSSATTRFLEINASPGNITGPARTMRVPYIIGALGYAP